MGSASGNQAGLKLGVRWDEGGEVVAVQDGDVIVDDADTAGGAGVFVVEIEDVRGRSHFG